MIQNFQLPAPPPEQAPTFQGWLQWIGSYGIQLYTYFNKWEQALAQQFNTLFNGYGSDIPSATIMTVANAVHRVTGSIKITTLNQPTGQTAVSPVTLLAQDGFTLGAGDNIGTPVSVGKGSAATLAYHPALKQWLSTPANPVPQLVSTSANSPFTALAGSYLYITADTGTFTANLPPMPELGDWVYGKKVGGTGSAVWQPPGGVTINAQAAGAALTITLGGSQLIWIGTGWQSYFQSGS